MSAEKKPGRPKGKSRGESERVTFRLDEESKNVLDELEMELLKREPGVFGARSVVLRQLLLDERARRDRQK